MEILTDKIYSGLDKIKAPNGIPWHDGRLNSEELGFLWRMMEKADDEYDMNKNLAGNIWKSKRIPDEDDWFLKAVIEPWVLDEFYRYDWKNYYNHKIKNEPPPEFYFTDIWVNYQKQGEFNPLHNHRGLWSFVIFMKIPTHWKDQHKLPISANSNTPCASDFQFVFTSLDGLNMGASDHLIKLGPEDEGRILLFPSMLHHQVYPFYGTDELRITISGNIGIRGEDHKKQTHDIIVEDGDEKIETTDPIEILGMLNHFKKNMEASLQLSNANSGSLTPTEKEDENKE